MGGGSNESNTIAKYEPPDFTKPLWEEAVARAMDISNVYGSGPDLSWQGPFAAPLVQEQIDSIGGMRGMMMPYFGDPQWLKDRQSQQNSTLMSALGGGMVNPYGGATNKALEDSISAMRGNTEKTFARTTGAATDAAAARGGAFGGSAYNEFKNAQAGELADTLNATESQMRNEQMNRAANLAESGFGRQMQALGLMPAMMNTEMSALQQLLGAGELSRGLDQQELEGAQKRHYQNVQQPMMALDVLLNALTRAGGGAGTTSTTMMGPGFSPAQMGMAGLLGLGSLFGG